MVTMQQREAQLALKAARGVVTVGAVDEPVPGPNEAAGYPAPARRPLHLRLLDADIPVVVCRPHAHHRKCREGCTTELNPPTGWSTFTVRQARAAIGGFRPGIDTLAMVGGHGIDVLDIDTKAGGDPESVPTNLRRFGWTRTPSGGYHFPVPSTGYGKGDLFIEGLYQGDYVGGTKAGGGRLLAFLPDSTRPKYPGLEYVEEDEWNIDALRNAQPGEALLRIVVESGLSTTSEPGKSAATTREVRDFIAAHSAVVDCAYGKAALRGILDETRHIVPNDVTRGRHPWASRATNRVVELMKAGCLGASALGALRDELERMKPGSAAEFVELARWAVANTEPMSGCSQHDPDLAEYFTETSADSTVGEAAGDLEGESDAGGHTEVDETAGEVATTVADSLIASGQSLIAEYVVAAFPNTLMFVPSIGWHFWDGTRWAAGGGWAEKRIGQAVIRTARQLIRRSAGEPDPRRRGELQRAANKVLSRANEVAGVMTFLSMHPHVLIHADELNADPLLFNVANGTLDLRTCTLRPHDPADRITKVAGTHYDPAAVAPRWVQFLAEAIPEDGLAAALNRCIGGVGLPGHQRDHVMPIVEGPGGSGKGTYLRAISAVFGDYAQPAAPDLLLAVKHAHPTAEMDLFGVRLAVASESDDGRALAAAAMKRITGGDMMKARAMGKDFVSFPPSHLIVLQTNHLPVVPVGDDDGTWRRVRVVPFRHQPKPGDVDKDLGEKLLAEAPGILRMLVDGYRDYVARGNDIGWPEVVTDATNAYRSDSDLLGQFLAEETETTPPLVSAVPVGPLYEAWKRWLAGNAPSVRPGRSQDFKTKLGLRGLLVEESHGRGARAVIRGLRLRTPTLDEVMQ